MEEIWKEIYDGYYAVSNMGRFKRLKIENNTYPGRFLKPGTTPNGYLIISASVNGKATVTSAHKIVAEVFLGPRPIGHQINHKNGDKHDNRVENLEWVTPSENRFHAYRTGLQKKGRRNKVVSIEKVS